MFCQNLLERRFRHLQELPRKAKEKLRQHRTILIMQMRRQIFRQTNQKDAGEMDFRQGILVQYDGKDASSCVIQGDSRELCGVALILWSFHGWLPSKTCGST